MLQALQDRRFIFLIHDVLILQLGTLDHHINVHAFFMRNEQIARSAQPVQHPDIFIIRVGEAQYYIFAHRILPNFWSYSIGAASPESLAHTSIQSSVPDGVPFQCQCCDVVRFSAAAAESHRRLQPLL